MTLHYHGLREAINRANAKASRKATESNRVLRELITKRHTAAARFAKAVQA